MPLFSSVGRDKVGKSAQQFVSEHLEPADSAFGLESAFNSARRAASHEADSIVLCRDASYTCCYDMITHINPPVERTDRRCCLPRTLRSADY